MLANLKRGSLIGVPRYEEGAAFLLSGRNTPPEACRPSRSGGAVVTYTVEEGGIVSSARVPGPVEIKTRKERPRPAGGTDAPPARAVVCLRGDGSRFGWLTIGQSSALAAFLHKGTPKALAASDPLFCGACAGRRRAGADAAPDVGGHSGKDCGHARRPSRSPRGSGPHARKKPRCCHPGGIFRDQRHGCDRGHPQAGTLSLEKCHGRAGRGQP